MSRNYLIGAWSGLAFLIVMSSGLLLAYFLPPHSPSASAQDIVKIYQEHATPIRIGMVVFMLGSGFYLLLSVTLFGLMQKMDTNSSFYSYCQLSGGILSAMIFLLPGLLFEIAAFRPGRSPELTQLINDAAWIFLITPVVPFLVQYFSLGAAVLSDEAAKVFPRWYGFVTIWTAILFAPVVTPYFFKTGPFAWDGIIAFWMPLVVFGFWLSITVYLSACAIKRLQ